MPQFSKNQIDQAVARLRAGESSAGLSQEIGVSAQTLDQWDRSDEMRQLISKTIHDCNNHLAAVLSNCDLIQMTADPALRLKKVESIRLRTEKLTSLVRALAVFVSIDFLPVEEPVDLREELNSVVESMQFDVDQSGVQISVEATDEAFVNMSEYHLQNLLGHLVANAIESAREGSNPMIMISLRTVDAQVILKVLDSGPSIRPEVVDRMFDPFFTTKANRIGLGLNIIQTLMRIAGGNIEYSSEDGRNCFILQFR